MGEGEGNKKLSSREGSRIIKESHLDFLFELYQDGTPLSDADIAALKSKGYIQDEVVERARTEKEIPINYHNLGITTDDQKKVDELVDIILEDGGTDKSFNIITDKELEERRKNSGYVFEGRKKEINKHGWLPDPNPVNVYEDEFVEWIDSINNGFNNRKQYRKFTLYVQQAYTWLQENKSYTDFVNEEEQEDYMMEELRRCEESGLYFMNKYGFYKDTNVKSGQTKYIAAPAHEIEAYLDDCGYSTGEAKPRQMAMTTTKMLLKLRKVVFKRNYFMKFITEDEKKAEEIFEDKLKYPFSELPYWMKPNVLNERDNFFKLGSKEYKGDRDGVNSTIRVNVPKRTAIAGGSPDEVDIDEAGNIASLTEMIDNQRPTRLWFNPETKKLEVKRKLNFYGTGGEVDRGGKAFEVQMLSLMKQWQERNFNAYIVPVFFSWHARPGATQADYDREYALAYADNGPDAEKTKREFHQSWPNSLADVFRTSANTLVGEEFIQKNIDRILAAQKQIKGPLVTHGYFEPLFDENSPNDEFSDTPFKIIGSLFIPCEDLDPRQTCTIFQHPKKGWKNRYFQGTDPIDTDAGTSNFASAIWDRHYQTISAIVNFRVRDVKYVFLQSMLLGMYYDTYHDQTKGCKELIESNRGTAYTLYKQAKGMGNNMTMNSELETRLMTANNTSQNDGVGIDNKGNRNKAIISYMHDMLSQHATKFYLQVLFEQLRTFVCVVTDRGTETWGPMNKKYFKDDVLFAAVFSYICAEITYSHLKIEDTNNVERKRVVTEYQLVYDGNFNQKRVPVKKRV